MPAGDYAGSVQERGLSAQFHVFTQGHIYALTRSEGPLAKRLHICIWQEVKFFHINAIYALR